LQQNNVGGEISQPFAQVFQPGFNGIDVPTGDFGHGSSQCKKKARQCEPFLNSIFAVLDGK
jgi:hypothetical protein